MGVMLAATDSLNWLSDILLSDPADLTGELPKQLLPPEVPNFYPICPANVRLTTVLHSGVPGMDYQVGQLEPS